MMNNERTKILQMLSEGKISAQEAAELLDASFPNAEITESRASLVVNEEPAQNYRPSTVKRIGFRGRWTNWANNLDGMRCDGANLDRSFFLANNLDCADFCDADVEHAKFFATNLDSAIFEGANLRGARILCSNLDGANFRNANLEGVTIFASNFDSANMEGADLRGQSFIATNMDSFNVTKPQKIEVKANEPVVLDGPISHI